MSGMDYNERPASPGTEKILLDYYKADDDSTNASVSASVASKRRHQQHSHFMGRKEHSLPPVRNEMVSDKINDMHFASDMIRRTVFTNQNNLHTKEHSKEHQQQLQRTPSVSSIATAGSDNEIEIRSSQRQMKGLQHSQSMQTIIHQVMEVHNLMTGTSQPGVGNIAA